MEEEKMKKLISRIDNTVFIFLIVILLIVANLIVSSVETGLGTKLDITRNGIYSLSGKTRDILGGLTENIQISSICKSGQEDIRIRELLNKYASASPLVSYKRLTGESQLPNWFTYPDESNSAVIISDSYGSMYRVYSYNDLYEFSDNGEKTVFRGESKITSAIQNITRGAFSTVYVTSGHGETPLKDLGRFSRLLKNLNFEVVSVDLSSTELKLNPRTDLLVMISPKADLEESEYEAVMDFSEAGGNIVLFMDRATFNIGQGKLQKYQTELPLLSTLMESFGLGIGKNIIYTDNISRINLRRSSLMVKNIYSDRSVIISEAAEVLIMGKEDIEFKSILTTFDDCCEISVEDMENKVLQTKEMRAFNTGVIAKSGNSRLCVISDSTCISDDALIIEGNATFVKDLTEDMMPNYMNNEIGEKSLFVKPADQRVRDVLSYVLLILITAISGGIIYVGIRINGKKEKVER